MKIILPNELNKFDKVIYSPFCIFEKNNFLENSIYQKLNESFSKQYKTVIKIMKKNNFKILHKNHAQKNIDKKSKIYKSFNYIFIR